MPYYVHDKIISPNIWDEKVGHWNYSLAIANGSTYYNNNAFVTTYMEVEPSTRYYLYAAAGSTPAYVCYYNSSKQYISGGGFDYSGTVTTPANATFMRLSFQNYYGGVYNHDICINKYDPAINGHYYPYNMGAKKYVIKDNNNSMNIGG